MLGIAGLGLLATACSNGGTGSDQASEEAAGVVPTVVGTQPIIVVTTLYPLEFFARRVGGESVEVVNLVAPGVEAHDFGPTPSDIRRLASADVVVYNGAGFEPWLDRALDASGVEDRIIVEASLGVAEVSGGANGHDSADPHVWLDPLRAVEQVRLIRDALQRADPDRQVVYLENADGLIDELRTLHQRFAAGLADCAINHFATAHDAFSYLALRYGLEAAPISGISPEVEPSPKELARLADRLKVLGVAYVMVEPNVSDRLADTLAEEVGAGTLSLHPLESLSPEDVERGETYFSIMEVNLSNLRVALKCGP